MAGIDHGWGQRGNFPLPANRYAANGDRVCCWCAGPLPTQKNNRRWCGPKCVHEYRLRADWPYLAEWIRRRDRLCQICKGARYRGTFYTIKPESRRFERTRKGLDCWGEWSPLRLAPWEVDHIIPVADGGSDQPANLRLLCRPCHVTVTGEWRRGRSIRRTQGRLDLGPG